MITKTSGEFHFKKDYGQTVGVSLRIILPRADGCRIKATRFYGRKGALVQGISYTNDETVFVTIGSIEVWQGDDESTSTRLETGSCYHVRAGESYNMRVVEQCILLCVFSPAVGPLPDDE